MKHFLSVADLTPNELQNLLDLGLSLKAELRQGGNKPVLKGKNLALVFMKPSLRTRVSFEMGMVQLGGYACYLSPAEIKLGGRESVPDVARVLSGYVDGVMARVFDHQYILDLAEYASIPIINGLSDYNHPAQGLADVFTILEVKGKTEGLKVAYVGDSNNVARSLMFAAMKLGMHMTIASPPGYAFAEEDLAEGRAMAVSGGTVEIFEDPLTAVSEADVIYTDVWTSMGQEEETERRLNVFPPFQVNQALVEKAKPDCIVMHCLPAHRGEEITDEVADGPHSILFQQAENRMHAQKALLVELMAGK
ncbi:MAG: ornithine carbamoyltransferase [Chloroflexi bacterium]|nr:MAG: ornithine carbamoyltransferase [Chloroflexota bacterium]